MLEFVLIVMMGMGSGGQSVTSVDGFHSKEACEQAADQVRDASSIWTKVKTVCVEKK